MGSLHRGGEHHRVIISRAGLRRVCLSSGGTAANLRKNPISLESAHFIRKKNWVVCLIKIYKDVHIYSNLFTGPNNHPALLPGTNAPLLALHPDEQGGGVYQPPVRYPPLLPHPTLPLQWTTRGPVQG